MKDIIAALEIKDRFSASLLNQFEENLYIIFGFGYEGLKTTLDRPHEDDRRGYSIDQELKEAFDEGGAPQLRWQMKSVIMNLHYIFLSKELGYNASFEEWVNSIESYEIGISRQDMAPSYLDGTEHINLRA